MNFRERALKVLKGEKPDRIPWFADLSWWMLAHREKRDIPEKYNGAEGFVTLHKELQTGLYLPLVWPYEVELDLESETEREGDREIFLYHTPKGTLREVRRHMPEAHTWSYEERLVKSSADLPAYRYFLEAHRFQSVPEEADRLDQMYGELGLPVVWVPRTPLSRFIVEAAGVESTVFALLEAPDEMRRIFDLMRDFDDEPYRAASETTCDLVMIADNLSSEIVSPNYFREYSLEYYRMRSEELHEAGKYVLAHIDGTLRGLLPILNSSGIDAAEGITPAPVGDVSPGELRSVTGDKIILWGGIPGALFSPAHTDSEFEEYVRRYIETAASDGRMILGVGDQVPPEADLERVKIVSHLCETYG